MNYMDARTYLKNLSKKGSDFSLSPMFAILDRLNNPQDKLNIIHVAGTNGKGSTITYLSKILEKAGYLVGSYTSPAVFNYNEMFKINGNDILDSDFTYCFNKVYEIVNSLKDQFNITSYMIETAICYLYFYLKKVDFLIVECGLGGKYDATNVEKDNILSILVSIDLDHTNVLGDLKSIATHKSGIIRNTCVTTFFNEPVIDIIKSHSKNLIVTSKATSRYEENFQIVKYKDKEYKTKLLGSYQSVNLPIAIESALYLKSLGYKITEENIYDGIKEAEINGRFEVIDKEPLFIIDGCHNPNASIYLESYLKTHNNVTLIMGIFKDKDYIKVVENTAKYAKKIYTFNWENSRHLDGLELKNIIEKYNKNVEFTTLQDAINKAKLDKDTIVIAFGSLSFLKIVKQEVQNGR